MTEEIQKKLEAEVNAFKKVQKGMIIFNYFNPPTTPHYFYLFRIPESSLNQAAIRRATERE